MPATFTSSSLKWDPYPAVKVGLLVEDDVINTWLDCYFYFVCPSWVVSVCPRACVFKIIVRQLEENSFAFLVVCWNDQSLLHFIYPPPLQQDKWMTPSQLYIQTHNLRMIFRHVGEYPGQRKSRKLVKTRKCTPPPLTPFSDNTLLRHVDQSCFFTMNLMNNEQWDWLCGLTRNTFLSELWGVRPKYWKLSILKQYVLHWQGIWKCQNFFNIPTANKEMWRTRIILSFGTSPQKILGGIE